MSTKVLLTGATGFVGAALAKCLLERPGYNLSIAVRKSSVVFQASHVTYVSSIDETTQWREALLGVDVVIHAAGRSHCSDAPDDAALCHRVNTLGTLSLARQSAALGVKRFIFISSIMVNGNLSTRPFTESGDPAPADPYARSKWAAEQGLWEIHQETGMEVVIIRPPLVYGEGVSGNFAQLMKLVASGIPLPLGAVNNKRSLIGLDNLVDLIVLCIKHPSAANQLFLAADGQDLSMSDLLRGLAQAMNCSVRLLPVPAGILSVALTFMGRREIARRLLGSLQVDITKARRLLGWKPPFSVSEGFKRCVRDSSS